MSKPDPELLKIMDPKVWADPFYRDLALSSEFDSYKEFLAEAGFFYDSLPNGCSIRDILHNDVKWQCTPLDRVSRSFNSFHENPVVLVTTGAMCPAHSGHVYILERAAAHLKKKGYHIIGGFLSPGHDEYIRAKLGNDGMTTSERLQEANRLVTGSDWISVDPWEALHVPVAVNFTEVVSRLRDYISYWIGNVEVVYVCGSDNSDFSLAFSKSGMSCVVSRPGYEAEFEKYKNDPRLNPDRNFFCSGTNGLSSTELRKNGAYRKAKPVRTLSARDTGVVSVSSWTIRPTEAMLDSFRDKLLDIIQKHCPNLKISCTDLRTQIRSNPYGGSYPTVSLDPMLPGDFNLEISRVYQLGGYRRQGHVPRPGSLPFEAQIQDIPERSYLCLIDDDVVTGRTVAAAANILAHYGHTVALEVFLNHEKTDEICDIRDFMFGATYGGLVVISLRDNEHYVRAPYILPYVDPWARCSITPESIVDFSIDVWNLNLEFFSTLSDACGKTIRVSDLDPHVIDAMSHLNDVSVIELCAWHVKQLNTRKGY